MLQLSRHPQLQEKGEKKKGLPGRLITLYATAMVSLTACESKVFIVPGPQLESSQGGLQTCQALQANVAEYAGRRPWYAVPQGESKKVLIAELQPLPTLFEQKFTEEEALEMLLNLRKKLDEANNTFVEREGYGFSTSALTLDEKNVRKRWELAMYMPMIEFIQTLQKRYPDLYPCIVNPQDGAPVYSFASDIIEDFALVHGLTARLSVAEVCDKGTLSPYMSFIVDQKVQTTVHDESERVIFDDSLFKGAIAPIVPLIHSGIHSAKKLHARVHKDLPHLQLTVPEQWELIVQRGVTSGLSNASVSGTTMTISNVHNVERLQKTIAHEYGHILHANVAQTIKQKQLDEGAAPVDVRGLKLTARKLYEAIGELFELWDVIQQQEQGVGFESQVYDILTQNYEDYRIPRELFLFQLEDLVEYSHDQLRAAMLHYPKDFASSIARAYDTQAKQEEMVIRALKQLDEIAGIYMSKDWSKEKQPERHDAGVGTCQ